MGQEIRKEASSLLAKALGADLTLEVDVAVKPASVGKKPPAQGRLDRMPRANADASLLRKSLDG